MKSRLAQFFQKHLFVLLLVSITVILIWQNYKPGTWLTGWDTLHPEFDFSLNLQRVIFGVWRENQGLGALAGHSHMADLPRILFLWLSSIALPLESLRYFYFFVTLILGPLGVYFFLNKVVFREKDENFKNLASFLGGLFYLLNLGTLQHFYVPFEMFATQYAFLPWLFLLATNYLLDGGRKKLLAFSLVTLLATPMAYAATLWHVYFVGLVIYLLTIYLIKLRKSVNFKRILLIVLASLTINSFWLIPHLYDLATVSNLVEKAKINQMFSEKAFLNDYKYATIENAAILKGFLFDWQEFDKDKFVFLMDEWRQHLDTPGILIIGYALFAVVLIGVIYSLFKRESFGIFLIPFFIFNYIFLLHANFPVNSFFDLVRDKIDLFREGLRFPWTKFSLVVIFSYSVFFSIAIFQTLKLLKNKIYQITISVLICFLLIIWMFPAFQGNLISPSRKEIIPDEYFKTFSWFKTKPTNERIAFFPVPNFWGWDYSRWGFEGAGFLWFGLKQPILVRDFDRWDPANENFYWEINNAVYSKDIKLLESVIDKYQVKWLLVDGNSINPSFPMVLHLEGLDDLFSTSNRIHLVKTEGKIKIYNFDLQTPVSEFVFAANNLPDVQPIYHWNNFDRAYLDQGNYLSDSGKVTTYYPFRTLFAGKNQEDLEFNVREEGQSFIFKATLPKDLENYVLNLPAFAEEEFSWINPENLGDQKLEYPEIFLDGKLLLKKEDLLTPTVVTFPKFDQGNLEIKIPRVGGYYSLEIDPVKEMDSKPPDNCNKFDNGTMSHFANGGFLQLNAKNSIDCGTVFWGSDLPHRNAYLVSVQSQNLAGKSLTFWIENKQFRKADLETNLPKSLKETTTYFVLPPSERYGIGYDFHFDNTSIGLVESVNRLGKISVNPIPFTFLTQINVSQLNEIKNPLMLVETDTDHFRPYRYKVSLKSSQTTLVLSQSFNSGWVAYKANGNLPAIISPLLGKKIDEHFRVNNWANGWVIGPQQGNLSDAVDRGSTTVYIIYLPQYLEFLGFGFLLIGGLIFSASFIKGNRRVFGKEKKIS